MSAPPRPAQFGRSSFGRRLASFLRRTLCPVWTQCLVYLPASACHAKRCVARLLLCGQDRAEKEVGIKISFGFDTHSGEYGPGQENVLLALIGCDED